MMERIEAWRLTNEEKRGLNELGQNASEFCRMYKECSTYPFKLSDKRECTLIEFKNEINKILLENK